MKTTLMIGIVFALFLTGCDQNQPLADAVNSTAEKVAGDAGGGGIDTGDAALGMMGGLLLGNMMGGSGGHHTTTIIKEKKVYVQPSRSSYSPSRSSFSSSRRR